MLHRLLLAPLLVLALAFTAFAQEEQDHYEKMIGAVKERKDRSYQQVMSAPGAVDDLMRHKGVDLGFEEPRRDAKPVVSPFEEPEDPWFTTTGLVALILVGLGAAGFWVTLRFATRGGRGGRGGRGVPRDPTGTSGLGRGGPRDPPRTSDLHPGVAAYREARGTARPGEDVGPPLGR